MKTADPEMVRAINRFHVMDVVRRRGPIARVELSESTELSPTTISSITAALIDDGLIETLPLGTVRDTSRGRPRVLLKVRKDATHVVGAKLSPDEITVVLTNFVGEQIKSITLPVRLYRQPSSVTADLTEDAIRRCVDDAGLMLTDIDGIAVGLPGIVERASGMCRRSPVFQQPDVNFAEQLSERLERPVTIDTDTNMATLAQHWFGDPEGEEDFLVISVNGELGLGVMHDGELFRGANGLSPDIGDLLVASRDGGTVTRLAEVASFDAILTSLSDKLPNKNMQFWTTTNGLQELSAIAATDNHVQEAIASAGDALGRTIANLIALFSPPRVILVGAALEVGPVLTDAIMASVQQWTPGSLSDVTRIAMHNWNNDVWAQGAAAMSLLSLYGAPWQTTGPAKPAHPENE